MIDAIKKKINELKTLIHENSLFLNTVENFQYLPLKESDLHSFEKKHQISIPKSYRDFLIYIGNGGYGPNQGIIPLELNENYQNLHLPWTNPETYNKIFKYNSQVEGEDEYDERVDALLDNDESVESKLFDDAENGVLCIGNEGCGAYTVLVISGKNRGQVWTNLTVNEDGFLFRGNDFLSWYEAWLDKKIKQVKVKNESIKNSVSKIQQISSAPITVHDIHKIVGVFWDVNDKTSINHLFNKLLKIKNLPSDVLDASMDYTINNEQFINHPLSLKFLNRFFAEKKDHTPEVIKQKLSLKGKVLLGLNKFEQALICFEKALDLSSNHYPKGILKDEYFCLLGYAYLRKGQTEKVKSIFTPVNEHFTYGNAVSLLIDLYRKHKDYEATMVWAKALMNWNLFLKDSRNKSYFPIIRLYLFFANARLGNDEFLDVFFESKSNLPFKEVITELYASKYYKRTLTYLDEFESQTATQKDIAWLYNMKGCCYSETGNFQKAIHYFLKSFSINHWLVPYSNLIRNYIHLEELDKAKQIFHEIRLFAPYYSWNYYQYSLFYIKTEQYNETLDLLKKAISLGFDKKIIVNDGALKPVHSYFNYQS